MVVVVFGEQNDEECLVKKGFDYKIYRECMIKEDIDEKFKDLDDNFCIVFVCVMWFIGFDVLLVLIFYLDKLFKNYILMQIIVCVN